MKLFFTFIILFSISPIFAQYILSVPVYQYTAISEPLHIKKDQRIGNGLFVENIRTHHLSFIGGITFTEDKIYDDCDGCADHFYGIGEFREIAFFGGAKVYLRNNLVQNIKLHVSAESYLAKSIYRGEFEGGFIRQGYTFDDSFFKLGLLQRVGLDIYLTERILISPITGLRFSIIQQSSNIYDHSNIHFDIFQWLPFEIRLGVVF